MLCWGHKPKESLAFPMSFFMLYPQIFADPEVGENRPVNIDIVVVFPAPLWPNNAVISPKNERFFINYLYYSVGWNVGCMHYAKRIHREVVNLSLFRHCRIKCSKTWIFNKKIIETHFKSILRKSWQLLGYMQLPPFNERGTQTQKKWPTIQLYN